MSCRESTLSGLARFKIGADFLDGCLQARREADTKLREKEKRETGPEELLIATVGTSTVLALFHAADGALVDINPSVHSGMSQDSFHITDWDGRTVDFRYFYNGDHMEPYHISDGLRTIKVHNLGQQAVYFGKARRKVVCPPGMITAIPAAEHDCEGLFSPDAVNGKGLYQKLPSDDDRETDDS